MAPAASKKGSRPAPPARDRRSSSRQSTPLSPLAGDSAPPTPLVSTPTSAAAIATANTQQTPSPPKDTAYIHTATSSLISSDPAIEMLISRISTHPTNPPPAKGLHTLHDRIKDGALKVMTRRSEVCDRSMRQLVQKRKERLQLEQERELAAVDAARVKEEEGERRRAKKEKEKEKNGKKRSAEEMEGGGEDLKERRDSLPSVGAHGVARQDGVGVGEGEFSSFMSLRTQHNVGNGIELQHCRFVSYACAHVCKAAWRVGISHEFIRMRLIPTSFPLTSFFNIQAHLLHHHQSSHRRKMRWTSWTPLTHTRIQTCHVQTRHRLRRYTNERLERTRHRLTIQPCTISKISQMK